MDTLDRWMRTQLVDSSWSIRVRCKSEFNRIRKFLLRNELGTKRANCCNILTEMRGRIGINLKTLAYELGSIGLGLRDAGS